MVTIDTLSLPTSNVSSCMSSSCSSCSTNSMNFLLPITSTRSTYPVPCPAKHQPQTPANRLLRQDIRLGRIGPQPDDNRHPLHVPAFTQHHYADRCS